MRKLAAHWTPAAVLIVLALTALPADADENDAEVVKPFNEEDLDGWKLKGPEERSRWTVGSAKMDPDYAAQFVVSEEGKQLVNARSGGVDIYTEQKFGDCTITLEFMVPRGSNSGIYVMGEYEVQILDSYGKEQVGAGDLGGLYGAAAPRLNAAKPPGEWQKFEIEFQAPRFEGDRKVANAVFKKITLNGEVIHEDVEMKGPTPSGVTGREAPEGPLMFQGDHGPVAFRNIRIVRAEGQ